MHFIHKEKAKQRLMYIQRKKLQVLMGARNCKRVQGWKVRLDLFRLDIRQISIRRIINCWNNLRAEVVSLSLENIAVLCCMMFCNLIMAFGFKTRDNRDSVSMEEVKTVTWMLIYC